MTDQDIMAHDFKSEPFSGTLWDLIAECRRWLPNTESLLRGQRWVLESWGNQENIFPVRKFAPYNDRGTEILVGGRKFVAVDNEPLTAFYKCIANGSELPPMGQLFGSARMPASWKFEAKNVYGWKTGGVEAPWRKSGIKLAHLLDAARGIDGAFPDAMRARFVLGFSPLNIFSVARHY